MDNHVHFFINTKGYDISKFMRALNTAYVSYFNKRHQRHGPLYQGRFGSVIVDKNMYYLTLMAYIHNNASDLPGYKGIEETYSYSSYGFYTGYRKDELGIVDTSFLLGMFSDDKIEARKKCIAYTNSMKGNAALAEVDDKIVRAYTENEYRDDKKHILRDEKPGSMVKRISSVLGVKTIERLTAKHIRETSRTRAFVTYVLRVLCGYNYRMICEYFGNMSHSGIARLFREGFRLIGDDPIYRNAFFALTQ